MENLVFNFSGTVRPGRLYGREYLIADATLLVPGVLAGSRGPLLYPPEDTKNAAEDWNGVPIMVYHPGEGSSKTPAVMDKQGIGTVFNATFTDRLRAELWFDAERTNQVDSRVYESLQNSQQIELSTGLFTTNEEAEPGAVFNTPNGPITYTHIARDHRPDHLAVLPDQVGACSLGDGCGVLNQLSHGDIRDALSTALKEQFPSEENLWVVEIFKNAVVFETSDSLLRIGYTRKNDALTLVGSPEKVQRVTKYKVVNKEQGGPNMAKISDDDRKELIGGLIKNSCCWEEDDRPELESMTDNQLNKTKESSDKQAESELLLNAAEEGFNDDRDGISFNREKREWSRTQKEPDKKEPVVNQDTKTAEPITEEEWLAQAPESVRNTLAHAKEGEDTEKKGLIAQITANVSDNDKPNKVSFLSGKPIKDLREIASFMPEPKQRSGNYYAPQPTANVEEPKLGPEDALEPMDMDFTANSVFADSPSK